MADATSRDATLVKSSTATVKWLSEPVLVQGAVQHGLGRGSRDLGTPTANLPGSVLDGVSSTARDGVYVGFGSVPEHVATPMKFVANLGHNITYGDIKERMLEAYLMEEGLPLEFYGSEMRLCILGYLRPELKFDSLDDLIAGIKNDVAVAKAVLDDPKVQQYRQHAIFALK